MTDDWPRVNDMADSAGYRFGHYILAVGLLGALAVAGGCTSNEVEFPSGGSTASGGGGGTGGSAGGGPCGMDCSTIETDQCLRAVCDEADGICVVEPATNGLACDDGLFCTIADRCFESDCLGGGQNLCGIDPLPCQNVICNEAAQDCSLQAKAEGADCDAPDLCIINAHCSGGSCEGEPRNCLYGQVPDECHVSECNPQNGECEPVIGNEGLPCVDPANPCQVDGICSGGVCTNTQPKNCSSETDPLTCTVGVCNSSNGDCEGQVLPDNAACDDLNPCTFNERCLLGVCTPTGAILNCGPADGCCPVLCDENNDVDCVLDVLLILEDVAAADWDAYRTALTAAGETWDEVNLNSQPFPDATTLAGYNTIVWGDENTVTDIGDPEAQRLIDWLGLGSRHLFVTGLDIMWDLRGHTSGPQHDLYAMWGVTYLGDYAGSAILTIEGVLGDPITTPFVSPNGLQLAGTGDSNGDYVDESLGPAAHAGIYAGGAGSGLGHGALSRFDAGGYQVVWLGVNFHNGLSNATQRSLLMASILGWFKN